MNDIVRDKKELETTVTSLIEKFERKHNLFEVSELEIYTHKVYIEEKTSLDKCIYSNKYIQAVIKLKNN